MKAAVYYGPGDIRVEQRPEPERTDENMVAEVACCAICGTDLKLSTVGNPRCHPPRIIGHEMVGKLVHVGSKVDGFSVGERITLATTVSCGECEYCALGLGNVCPSSKPISYDFDGAFAEFVGIPPLAIRGGNVIEVPDSVPDDAAALSEPISCCVNAHQIAGLKAGDKVLVVGGGPLGVLHAELAKAEGAGRVMISEKAQTRVPMLLGLKNVRVIDASKEDVLEVVKAETGGLGADVVVVAAPNRFAQEESLAYARKGGAVSLFASLPKGASEITIDSRLIHYNELRVVGASDSRPEHVREAVRLIAEGKFDTDVVITHRVAIDDIHKGLELMETMQSLKVLVYPKGLPR